MLKDAKREQRAAKKKITARDRNVHVVITGIDTNFAFWLGMALSTGRKRSDFDYIRVGQRGIPKGSIDHLAQRIGMSRKNLAEKVFAISVKTLERKSPKTKLDKKISSHAVEIAKVLEHASEVFGDNEKVKDWINRENKALNNMKPVDLFDTLTGLNMVNDILGRIEEGVYS